MPARCYFVPPHLLRAIASSSHNSDETRRAAHAALASYGRVNALRKERMAAISQSRRENRRPSSKQPFVPQEVLRNLAQSEDVDEATRARAQRDLDHVVALTERKKAGREAFVEAEGKPKKEAVYRAVYDAKHTEDEEQLPGKLARAEGQANVEDKAVNEAFDNVGLVLEFYKSEYKWKSIDDKNMDVISSVHFGQEYENAFWDPDVRQMVYGDGGEFLNNFTACIDVIGHEMTHAVTEYTSPLDYEGQPGALNEHVSDVFGIMIKQKHLKQKADEADWLIGEDCILPGVKGVAIRSMKKPGTAYDDPRFGKDPQVDNMSGFEDMFDDNGGVHIFSGIPNKAFYEIATAFGGNSWEKAGQIWWKTMRSGRVPEKCTFLQFADVTVDVAKEEFGDEAAKTVRKAWNDVGVTRSV